MHSISSIDSARTKCLRHASTMAALSAQAGGPRSKSPLTPPCISKLGTMNILRRMSSSKTLRLKLLVGSEASWCFRKVSAWSLRDLSASTAAAISSALEEDSFLRVRTRAPCLVIWALRESISSWRAEPVGRGDAMSFIDILREPECNGDEQMVQLL